MHLTPGAKPVESICQQPFVGFCFFKTDVWTFGCHVDSASITTTLPIPDPKTSPKAPQKSTESVRKKKKGEGNPK